MAYGVPAFGAPDQMATPKRPVQLAPNIGTTPRPQGRTAPTRRVQAQPGRRPQQTQRRKPTPGGMRGPAVPSDPIADPMQFPPLAEEVGDLGAAVGMARFPGVGAPGSERGVLNMQRRRRV